MTEKKKIADIVSTEFKNIKERYPHFELEISKFKFDPDFSGLIATLWRCHLKKKKSRLNWKLATRNSHTGVNIKQERK